MIFKMPLEAGTAPICKGDVEISLGGKERKVIKLKMEVKEMQDGSKDLEILDLDEDPYCTYCDALVKRTDAVYTIYGDPADAKLKYFCSHTHRRSWVKTIYNDSLFKLCMLKIHEIRMDSNFTTPPDQLLITTLPPDVLGALNRYTPIGIFPDL